MADPTWRPETLAQHLGEEQTPFGAPVPPLFQNSNFLFKTWEDFQSGAETPLGGPYHYSRMSNPTCEVAERKIAALEGTDRCKLFASGMAAISTCILASVKSGAHVVCVDSCYGPTRQFIAEYLPRFGVESTFVVGEDPAEIEGACRPETTLIYLESPTSILFRLQDLEAIGRFARQRGITTIIDNTYASPVYQNPAQFGIDYVCHTASKYLGGHGDLIAGAVCCSEERMAALTKNELPVLGNTLPPFQAWLIVRSLRTLHLKLRAVRETADAVATWLCAHPGVERVFHVGLADHPQRALRDRQMRGWTGLLSFIPKDQREASVRRLTEGLRLFGLGVSWGGHESLVVPLELQAMDWPEKRWVVRLYCGLEHKDDLIADLAQAFCLVAP